MKVYSVGDVVLMKEKNQEYEVRILKVEDNTSKKKKNVRYLIHYVGWNSRWDAWVDSKTIVRLVEAVKAGKKNKTVSPKHEEKKRKSNGGSSKTDVSEEKITPRRNRRKSGNVNDLNMTKSKKSKISPDDFKKSEIEGTGTSKVLSDKNEETRGENFKRVAKYKGTDPSDDPKKQNSQMKETESASNGKTETKSVDEDDKIDKIMEEETASAPPKMKLKMGLPLKTQLAKEWEHLSQENPDLMPLPRHPTVAAILKQFVDSRKQDITSASFQEFAEGLQNFFDKALPLRLLYSSEMMRHEDFFSRKENSLKRPSEIYGAEHFLRLFVLLGDSLNTSVINKREKKEVQEKVTGILQFLQKNEDFFPTGSKC